MSESIRIYVTLSLCREVHDVFAEKDVEEAALYLREKAFLGDLGVGHATAERIVYAIAGYANEHSIEGPGLFWIHSAGKECLDE